MFATRDAIATPSLILHTRGPAYVRQRLRRTNDRPVHMFETAAADVKEGVAIGKLARSEANAAVIYAGTGVSGRNQHSYLAVSRECRVWRLPSFFR